MIITDMKVARKEGEYLPSWYYGYCYYDSCKSISYFYVMPLNYFIIFWRNVSYCWNRFRSKPSWIDLQILQSKKDSDTQINKLCRQAGELFSNNYKLRKENEKLCKENFYLLRENSKPYKQNVKLNEENEKLCKENYKLREQDIKLILLNRRFMETNNN